MLARPVYFTIFEQTGYMRFLLFFISGFLFLIGGVVSAQYYETGQDPASLKWMQIKTDRFTVIYPKKYGNAGIDFARSLDESYLKLTSIFPSSQFRIPVVIHNFTVQSNGYVAWAPKRMEIYPTPQQNSIPLDPNSYLTMHELTHVLQMESLNKGFSKAMSFIFGEQFPGVVSSLLPLWYLEGDAVYSETMLSGSGRGRSPSFLKQLKAISVERGNMFKYDKIVNGSFRDFVPDHYQSGYLITSWSKYKYGQNIWNDALRFTSNMPFTINPVNISLLKTSGVTKKRLYEEAFDTLSTVWNNEISANGSKPYRVINSSGRKSYTSYFSPVKVDKNSYVAIKTSLYSLPSIVMISQGDNREKKMHVPGRVDPYILSSAGSKVTWVENRTDPRWENRSYSVIMLMDTKTGRVKQVTRKSRYMSASISPDGLLIAASENTVDNRNNLVLINAETGKEVRSFPVPANAYIQRPQWSGNGADITVISLTTEGEGIMAFNIAGQTWKSILEGSTGDYQASYLRNDSLFFVSSSSGTENIYVMSNDKAVTQLTNSRFGATDFIVDGSQLIFSDYTSSGNKICITQIGSEANAITPVVKKSDFIPDSISNEFTDVKYVPGQLYNPVPYRKYQHLFRFHSWMPFYADLDEVKEDPRSLTPGFTIMSQNTLSTLESTTGYEYSDDRHKFHSRITWKGWYPVFESRIDYGEDNFVHKLSERIDDPDIIRPGTYFTGRALLPLSFSSGGYYQYLQPSLSVSYANNYIYIREQGLYDYGQTQLSARLYFANYRRSSVRDIYPRFAQIADVNYSFYPFDNTVFGGFLTLRTALYLPGVLPNNSIRLKYEWDKQYVEKIPFMNRIDFPRGYKNISSEDLQVFTASYHAPLVYPDFGLLSLFYLTRIRASFFYDYAIGTGNYYLENTDGRVITKYYEELTENFWSYGIELLADCNLFRLPYTVSAGVRTSWNKADRTPAFELLFNIDVFGMNIGKSRF